MCMLTLTGVCTVVSVSILFFILGYLVFNGWTIARLGISSPSCRAAGETGGGMANAIVGSAKILCWSRR